MIFKSTARGNGGELADHLLNPEENERIELREVHGLAAVDVHAALSDMQVMALGAQSRRPIIHVMMNPQENMTEDQWKHAWNRYEAEYGLHGAPFVEVEHHKRGRTHRHRAYYALDLDTGKAIDTSWNKARDEKVARLLEYELGHSLTKGAHNKRVYAALRAEGRLDVVEWMNRGGARDGDRPVAAYTHREWRQQKRTGIDARDVRASVYEAWKTADSGRAFAAALEAHGLQLAQGDKPGALVVVDAGGGTHEVSRGIKAGAKDAGEPLKLKVADVKARCADLPADTLPTVAAAQMMQEQRTQRLIHQVINETINQKTQETQSHERRHRRDRKPHVAAVGTQPPPAARNRLRKMSELGVVQFPDARPVLLPRDVHRDVEHGRSAADHELRRAARLERTRQARQSGPAMQAPADAKKQAYKLRLLADRYGKELPPDVAQHLAWVRARDARPEVVVQLRDGARIRDDGAAIRAQGTADQRAIAVMIAMAQAKGWDRVNLTGSEAFRRQAAEALTRAGLGVANTDLAEIVTRTRAQMEAEVLQRRLAEVRQERPAPTPRPKPQEAPKAPPASSAPPKASPPPAAPQVAPLRQEISRYAAELTQLQEARTRDQALAWAKQWTGPDGQLRDFTARGYGIGQLVPVRMSEAEAAELVDTQRAKRQPEWATVKQTRRDQVEALEKAEAALASLGMFAKMDKPGAEIRARISGHQAAIDRAEIQLGKLDTAWRKQRPTAIASVLEEAERMRKEAAAAKEAAVDRLPQLDTAVQDREQLVKALREMDAAGFGVAGAPSTASAGDRDAHVRRQAEQWRQQQEQKAREEAERLRQQQEQQPDQGPRRPSPRRPGFR